MNSNKQHWINKFPRRYNLNFRFYLHNSYETVIFVGCSLYSMESTCWIDRAVKNFENYIFEIQWNQFKKYQNPFNMKNRNTVQLRRQICNSIQAFILNRFVYISEMIFRGSCAKYQIACDTWIHEAPWIPNCFSA